MFIFHRWIEQAGRTACGIKWPPVPPRKRGIIAVIDPPGRLSRSSRRCRKCW